MLNPDAGCLAGSPARRLCSIGPANDGRQRRIVGDGETGKLAPDSQWDKEGVLDNVQQLWLSG